MFKINRFAVPSLALVIGVGGALGASALTAHDRPSVTEAATVLPHDWTLSDLSDEDTSFFLASVLPYYRVNPPTWCAEDNPCWIGTNADGRTDREILDSLACNIAQSGANYTLAKVPASDLTYIEGMCDPR